jgi:hypothetical protein
MIFDVFLLSCVFSTRADFQNSKQDLLTSHPRRYRSRRAGVAVAIWKITKSMNFLFKCQMFKSETKISSISTLIVKIEKIRQKVRLVSAWHAVHQFDERQL